MIAALICIALFVALARWIAADAKKLEAEAWQSSRRRQS